MAAVLKTVRRKSRGFESYTLRHQKIKGFNMPEEQGISFSELRDFAKVMDDVINEIKESDLTFGHIICPLCGNILNFSVSKDEHVCGRCLTKNCLSWR
jgi:ribosomal protein S27AE